MGCRLIDEGAVRVDLEIDVAMSRENIEKVLPDKGLPAGDGDKINPHLFGLLKKSVDQGCFQFLSLVVLAGITAVTVQVATHGRADDQEERRVESVARFKFLPSGGGDDELVDDQIFGKFSQAFLGTPADGPPAMEQDAFEEISPFGIIRDRLQPFADERKMKKSFFADSRENP